MVTEVAKTANIAKMAKKCINCIRARPTPPHTSPMESEPEKTLSAQNPRKTKRCMIFNPQKGGVIIGPPTPPPTPTSLKTSKKWVLSGGRGGGGSDQKLFGGCVYWTK